MSAIEILSLSTNRSSFSKKTGDIQGVLLRWDQQGMIPGEALCCVTSLTPGVGVLVTDAALGVFEWEYRGSVTVGDSTGTSSTDLKQLAEAILRPSEIFMVRGPKILGAWDVWVYNRDGSGECRIAVSLL